MFIRIHKLGIARLGLKPLRDRLLRLTARRAVIVLAALFLLLFTAGDAVLLWLQHESKLEESTQEATNLTVVLEQYVRQSLQHLDALLLNVMRGKDGVQGWADPGSSDILRPSVMVEDLRVYGPTGQLMRAAKHPSSAALDWSQQEPFLHHRKQADTRPFLGKPILEDGVWRRPFSRRITGLGGSFQGIAVVMIDVEAFASFFRSVDLGRSGSIIVVRRDGEVIASYPPVPDNGAFSVANSTIFARQILPLAEGSGVSVMKDTDLIGNFRSVVGLPLIVVVFIDKDDALASWHSLVRQHVGILGAVALAVILLVTLINRQQANLARVAREMREEQRRVEAISAHLPAALIQRTRDASGGVLYTYVSAGSEAVLGMPREAFLTNPRAFAERIPSEDRIRIQAVLTRSVQALSDVNEEFRVVGPESKERWLRMSARPRRQESGTVVWDALILDVTAHKTAVADKRALEQRLEAIVSNVPGVVFQRSQRRDGSIRYTFISASVEGLFGVTAQEVMHDHRALGIHAAPEDRVDLEASFDRQDSHHTEWSKEFRVKGADRLERWVRGTATRHQSEETGEWVWDGILLDVTMQKAAVAATRALQRRMEAIVANTPGVVFECIQNATGRRFSFISPQVEQIFHIPIREALHDFNRVLADVLPEDRPLLERLIARHHLNLEDWVAEFRVQCKGQPLRWIRSTARARRQEDGTVVWNGVFQDVTQSKTDEEQAQRAQRNEALAHLTAGVAHEFNNLLTVIQGNLELMELDEQAIPELIPPTQRAAERGARVTRALQAYSRRQSLRPRTGCISENLQEVTVLLHSILGQSVQLELQFPEDTWPIHVDWDQLGNALIALAMKGKDAMPSGGALRIETRNQTLSDRYGEIPSGDYVQLSVTDGGQALPEEVRRHAFDPFYSATALGGGGDLGLSTVFGFVRQSRGHVSLDSCEGQGTTVTILLPRAPLPEGSTAVGTALS